MQLFVKPMLIINICRLFCIREFVAYHLRVTDLFFRSGKTINKLSYSFFLLLLFCYSNVCAANHQDLVEALKTGNEKMIEQLMQNENIGINDQIELPGNCGCVCPKTPLTWLARYGHTRLAENFIKKGADVNAKNGDGSTALMFAALQGHIETVTLLLDHKANINEENIDGCTPLAYAISQEHVETVIYLINSGADINFRSRAFYEAPLILAAEQGSLQIVTLLVERGANVNTQNVSECTPLIYAISHDRAETAKYLIAEGADVNRQNSSGHTALTCCLLWVEKDFIDIIKLLISKGADFDISNPVHARSLCKAFKRFCQEPQKSLCQFDILKVLLDFIKPNETNNFVVKTFSSRKRSFLFQQKIDDKINEDILIEDLSALKVESISGSPLQDAAKYIIQKATTPIN